MNKLVFSFPIEQAPSYLAFGALPTATNEDASFPASNLLNYDPTRVFRTTAGSTVITWNFGAQRLFNVVSLLYTNASYRCTLLIETSTNGSAWTTRYNGMLWACLSADPGAGPFSETADPRRLGLERQCSWFMDESGVTAQYVRLTISDPIVTNITIGRLFVGRQFTPAKGYQYGSTVTFSDTGQKDRTDKGAMVLDEGRSIVGASIKLEFASSAEMYSWLFDLNFWRKQTREVLVCLDADDVPNRIKNTIYGTLGEGRQVVADSFNAFSQTISIESL